MCTEIAPGPILHNLRCRGLTRIQGPLLAYPMADPELSLQSILVTGKILGSKKTWTYVSPVTIFSTLAGYIFGLVLTII